MAKGKKGNGEETTEPGTIESTDGETIPCAENEIE